MQFAVASMAYFSAVGGVIKLLAVTAHTVAVTAGHALKLPESKPSSEPTLVERRLTAQAMVFEPKPSLRRVEAMVRPEIPVAVMAMKLDQAETAFEPPPAVQVAKDITSVGPTVLVKTQSKKRAASSSKNRSHHRNKKDGYYIVYLGTASGLAKTRNSSRLAGFETPGSLMFNGLLKRQS